MKAFALEQRNADKLIGFVPTMGALHQGHLALVERAVAENDLVVCSIFVNPIQFNNPNDLKHYPRTLKKDLASLEKVNCDVVFHPTAEEMYPREEELPQYNFGLLEQVMEGRYRPGHFNGVAVVVKKLLQMVLPHRAYFGEKDYQQLAIVRELVKKDNIATEIVPCPTVREPDGLAMSSRNTRLSVEERQLAPLIYETLVEAKDRYRSATAEEVIAWVTERFSAHESFRLEYFELSDPVTLQPVRGRKPSGPVVACIAAFLGEVRLIDNMVYYL